MTKQPFFTLILPIYNVEKYLNRCIDSILTQKFNNYEIILVDDGSPDSCPKICDDWAYKDHRIKVIHKKNEGLGYARNTGLKYATGKYVWFVDSDDSIEHGALKCIYESLNKYNNPDVIFFGHSRINSKGTTEFQYLPGLSHNFYSSKESIVNNLLSDFIFPDANSSSKELCKSAWGCCIKNDTLKKNHIRFISEREYINEDYYFWIDNFDKFQNMVFIDEPLYLYYQNEDSLSLKYLVDRYEKIKKFDKKMLELVKNHNYPNECLKRVKGLFISNLLGCIKSEVKNYKNVGYKNSYKRFKKICSDEYVKNSEKLYNCKEKSMGWRIFSLCIEKRLYFLLYITVLIRLKKHD